MSERFKELVLKTSDGATHRGFESHSLRQQETHFCLPTKVRFLNDVCLRQMMLASPMMTASPDDVWLRHILRQTSHHRETKWSNIIFAKQMHYIAVRRYIIKIDFHAITRGFVRNGCHIHGFVVQ